MLITDEIKNFWFNPCYSISNFKKFAQQEGIERAFKSKKELEAYIAGIALLGIRYYEGRIWWLQVPEKDPPDILAATMSVNKKGIGILNIQEVEIFRVESYRDESITEAIKRKLHNKAYSSRISLIGLLNRDEKVKDLSAISNEIKKINVNISSIWIIGNLNPVQNEYLVTQLFPELKTYKINVEKECEYLKKFGVFMRTTRSIKKAAATRTQIQRRNAPLLIPGGTY